MLKLKYEYDISHGAGGGNVDGGPGSSASPEAHRGGVARHRGLPELTPDRDEEDSDASPPRGVEQEFSGPATPVSYEESPDSLDADADNDGSHNDRSVVRRDEKPAHNPFSARAPTVRERRAAQIQQVAALAVGRYSAAPSLIHRPRSRKPITPKAIKDWDPWKPILEELYMHQNWILKDVMAVMETNYNFKATAKMYKGQFARWHWFKYAVKRRPRDQLAKLPGKGKVRDGSLVVSSNHDTIDSMLSPMFFENDQSRVMHLGLTAVRHFLHGFVEAEPGTLSQDVVFLFDDPCYRYFKASVDLFGEGENLEGGRVLRLAFMQIDRKIRAPNIKSFSDLCLLVPHLLLEAGHPDILRHYLRYLSQQAEITFGEHPLTDLIRSFTELMETNRPEFIMRYIQRLSQINSDTVSNLRDVLERTRTWALNQSLACQQSGTNRYHTMPRLEAQSVYWAQHLLVRTPESDRLGEQWLKREFEPDFGERCEALLGEVKKMIARGEVPAQYARMIECLYCGLLCDFYEATEDWPKTFEWGLRGLDLSSEDQFIIWSCHLEGLMRQHGSVEQADALKQRRLSHEWLETVTVQLDQLMLTDS